MTQTEIVFGDTHSSDSYRLLELPSDLVPLFQDEDGSEDDGSGLIIRGLPNDNLVLVTGDATFNVRGLQTSNSMLILGSEREDGSRQIVAQTSTYLELTLATPKLERLKVLLMEHVFDPEEDQMEVSDVPALDTETLRSATQASDEELYKGLSELHAINIDGHWKILAPRYIKSLLLTIVYAAVAADQPLSRLDLDWCTSVLSDGERPPRGDVVEHVLHMFSEAEYPPIYSFSPPLISTFLGKYILKEHKSLPLDSFMLGWRKETPPDCEVDLKFLEGFYVTETAPGRSITHIHYISKDDLSLEPKDRFQELFARKQRWEEAELLPFIRDLAPDRKKLDVILLKFARVSRTGSTATYTTRF
ncbi:hypothetical protein M427DRAFT_156679 [Gonapodya prolifera JEL478]|uniref:Sister chromatid cohesion protein DCC1 n=1 Tax=Gonapodya prolifera (strain JEL478) TaxID=1344416 RepID=A0A139AA65_GONPJ|nr:hypothetical protein M427DRAFT_156679 [Gonapodya prolifera JEL478]|eukprot:KXS13395.1 hypothetical protein M427DRAFT_156679 [Gonapodya prolifera JEL478]